MTTPLTVGRIEFGPSSAPLTQHDTMAALRLMKAEGAASQGAPQ
jgi:hypothetical protein